MTTKTRRTARPTSARLAVRIYLLWLATVLLIALTIALVISTQARPPRGPSVPEYVIGEVMRVRADPAEFAAAIDRVRDVLGDEITIYDDDDRLIASSVADPPPPVSPEQHERLRAGERVRAGEGRFVVPLPADGPRGYALLRPRNGGPPKMPIEHIAMAMGLVLGGLAIASLLLARSITRPLGRLTATARSLGAGDLLARVGPMPRGEFGELGSAFDEMAGRVHDLLQAQRALLASVSHELRTPLARIRVALDLGAEGDAGAMEGLVDDLAQLERLVGDILTASSLELTRPGDTTSPLRREPIDLGHLLERAAAGSRAAFPSHAIDLRIADEIVIVDADAPLLRRVIDNLLDNARKYSEPGTRITVSLHASDDEAVVEVADHGIGIDAADLPHLFTPFFRGDRSRARRTGGVGLGLALARRIVEGHEGRLHVSSQPGLGTTVTMSLPRLPT